MKMKVTTKTSKEISADIPHDVFTRFLKSLGFPVNADTVVQVEGTYSYGQKKDPIKIKYTYESESVTHEQELMDDQDLSILAGIAEQEQQ